MKTKLQGLFHVVVVIPAVLIAALVPYCCLSAAPLSDENYSSTFDPEVAIRTWYFSKSTFCNRADIEAWNCTTCVGPLATGMRDVVVLHNATTRAQGFVGYDAERNWIVASFRGTDSDLNWEQDFDAFMVDYTTPNTDCGSGCRVHQGFFGVYNSLRPQLLAAFESVLKRHTLAKPTAMVTGHSLGAALSMLASVDLISQFSVPYNLNFTLYNFGEPRVGNPAFVLWATETVLLPYHRQYRVTHKADPVPRVPPTLFGYIHAPHEIWYNNDDNNTNYTHCVDNATHEDLSCSMSQYAIEMADHGLYMGIIWGCQ